MIKSILRAFLIGGLVGALSQGFFEVYLILISDVDLAVNLSIFTLAGGAGILTACGKFKAIDKLGGMGVGVPTCGLGAATADLVIEGRVSGKPMRKAFAEGLKVPLTLLGVAMMIGFISAVIMLVIG